MACSATPTATLYTSVASSSTSITFSPSVTTRPPVVTTFTTETCSATAAGAGPDETGCVTVEVAVVSTIDAGGPSTIEVPIQVVYEITQVSPTATLFASCPSQPPPAAVVTTSSSTSTSSSQASSSLSSPSTSSASFTTVITPAPSIVVFSQTTTRSDGSTVYVLTTYTSTFSPVSVVLPSTSGVAPGSHSSSSSLIAPVVGGILGGFFGLIGIVVMIWWLWRHRGSFSRPPTPDLPQMVYRSRPNSTKPETTTEPRPYHYGGLASGSNSHGSSRPNSPQARSSVYSQNNPPTTPHSLNRSSTGLSFNQSGAPTPTFFATTAISPGHSQPNSRSSTPGQFYSSSAPPSAYMRQSWPRYTGDGEEPDSPGSPTMYSKRERRPSRLSLTLSMMDDTRQSGEGEGGAGTSRRSTTTSMNGGDIARSPSMSSEMHVPEPSRSTLFVVNSEEPKPSTLTEPNSKESQSQSGHDETRSDEARSLYARAG